MASPTPRTQDKLTDQELADIQGIIVSGYGHLNYSDYLLLTFAQAEQAKSWLRAILSEVTSAFWPNRQKPKTALNLAVTNAGFAKLGLSAADSGFSEEFVQGMAEDQRSRRLGDLGANAPDKWEIGRSGQPIHALLILQCATPEELDSFTGRHRTLASQFGVSEVLPTQRGYLLDDRKEHFGYVDSISQPLIQGSPATSRHATTTVQRGEFLLGYENEYGQLPPSPAVDSGSAKLSPAPGYSNPNTKDFGKNGSYLVLRKLYQDVAAFRSFVQKEEPEVAKQGLLEAKLLGRWQDGTPVVLAPSVNPGQVKDLNDFAYAANDPDGMACPLGAHIRRSNPRDSLDDDPSESTTNVNRHRIMRRGVLYGERLPDGVTKDDGQDRGILFIAINADIRRQFEFVQQTWVNNPKFDGLYSDPDPIAAGVGMDGVGSAPAHQFTIPASDTRRRIHDVPTFVTMKGGAYFFLPGIAALECLASGDFAPPTPDVSANPLPAHGIGAFFVATAGEFFALFYWLKFMKSNEWAWAFLVLLLGFIVERAAVTMWLRLPANIRLVNGKTMPLWAILLAVTVAEIAVWIGWLELSHSTGVWVAALPFFVFIHVIHSTESAVITTDTLRRQILSAGPILLSLIETLTAVLWLHYDGLRGPVVGGALLLGGLLLEHTLQGIGLSRRASPQHVAHPRLNR